MIGRAKGVWIAVAVGLLALIGVVALVFTRPNPRTITFAPGRCVVEAKEPFSYDDYAAVLKTYVDDSTMVNYRGLKARRGQLNVFARDLSTLDEGAYEKWGEQKRIAFWVNAYNALTLEAIVSHYPIKSSGGLLARRYPKNSIRRIPGVWKKLQFVVMGKKMTLDEIEHNVLRERYNEPRIHVALVCAAIGCPPLRNEPYVAKRLDEQLDDQARTFLAHPKKFRIDRKRSRVHLSPIFKWFGADFVKTYGIDERFQRHSEAQRAVLNFISRYVDEDDQKYLTTQRYSISYLDYDWTLNEHRSPKGSSAKKR